MINKDSDLLADWLSYIEALHPSTIDLGLSRVKAVAQILGIERFACPVVMVAGTNGKGSTIATLKALLRAEQKNVAVYTSPHILTFNERVQFNDDLIEDQVFVSCLRRVEQARGAISLTYFEFTTLAAFLAIQQFSPDYVLLEIGLGGRLDAVNIIDPDICVITTIDYDHQAWLGNDLEQIAREKAGIYRANTPVVLCMPSPQKALLELAAQLNAPVYRNGIEYQFDASEHGFSWSAQAGQYINLPVCRYHPANMAGALCVYHLLPALTPSYDKVVDAFKRAFVPGRFDCDLDESPSRIIDVAHNGESARFLMQRLRQLQQKTQKKITAIVSILGDKEAQSIFSPFNGVVDEWIVLPLDVARGLTAQEVKTRLVQNIPDANVILVDSFEQIMQSSLLNPAHISVVFGSFYTAALAYEADFLPLTWKRTL